MKYRLKFLMTSLLILLIVPAYAETLLEKRDGFKTSIVKEVQETETLTTPPDDHLFELVKYDTELGKMAAYMTKPPKAEKNKKFPAIIWITGGHPQGGAEPDYVDGNNYKNNQTADMFFKRGIITFYPTFRGTFGNPGIREEFYGEVNDILAALKFLQQQSHIDRKHIYLGGHSTGATLALLVAAATDEFAGIISLGPQDDVKNHGGGGRLFDINNPIEFALRAPINHLDSVKSPTFIIEGEHGVSGALNRMSQRSKNPVVHFWEIPNADHFDVIQSTSELFADAIIRASQSQSKQINFNREQVENGYTALTRNMMQAYTLQHLAQAAANGTDINKRQKLTHYFYSPSQESIDGINKVLEAEKFTDIKTENVKNNRGEAFILLTATRQQQPSDLEQLFADQAMVERLEKRWSFDYQNWYIKVQNKE